MHTHICQDIYNVYIIICKYVEMSIEFLSANNVYQIVPRIWLGNRQGSCLFITIL